jgi:hypothetical protein
VSSEGGCGSRPVRSAPQEPAVQAGPSVPEAAKLLAGLRPRLQIGATFLVWDRDSERTATTKRRPVVIVGGLPPLGEPPEVSLGRPVRVLTRVSWKEHFGSPPQTEAEKQRLLRERKWVFTPAGLLPGFDLDGAFEIRPIRPVRCVVLVNAPFLGWLPLPYIAILATHATGARLPEPYPPENA